MFPMGFQPVLNVRRSGGFKRGPFLLKTEINRIYQTDSRTQVKEKCHLISQT